MILNRQWDALLRACTAASITLLATAVVRQAVAQDTAAGHKEMQKGIISSWPRPSVETDPVEFSVGGIGYRTPRNYLATMENWSGGPQALVTISINLPDLKPRSDETLAYFTAKWPSQLPGCEPFSFVINPPGGPSAEKAFERSKALFKRQSPTAGPSGFEKYETSPPDARTEYYRGIENGITRFYYCHFASSKGDSGLRHYILYLSEASERSGRNRCKIAQAGGKLHCYGEISMSRNIVRSHTPEFVG
jgi:hypothetical protein